MVSSIYHHVAVVRLDVHAKYLEFLAEGKVAASKTDDHEWYKPTISRTQWFDMFEPHDRGEALRAIWGVLAWETRPSARLKPLMKQQPSEGASGLFSKTFRKKRHDGPQPLAPQRSHSIG